MPVASYFRQNELRKRLFLEARLAVITELLFVVVAVLLLLVFVVVAALSAAGSH